MVCLISSILDGLKEANQWPEICKHFILEEFKQSRDINMDLESLLYWK